MLTKQRSISVPTDILKNESIATSEEFADELRDVFPPEVSPTPRFSHDSPQVLNTSSQTKMFFNHKLNNNNTSNPEDNADYANRADYRSRFASRSTPSPTHSTVVRKER